MRRNNLLSSLGTHHKMYIIIDGTVKITNATQSGKDFVIIALPAGGSCCDRGFIDVTH